MTKPAPRTNVAALRRADPGNLLRAEAMDMLTGEAHETPIEPMSARVKLTVSDTQLRALKAHAGDVPLARWIVLHLVRQGIIPQA